MNRNESLTDEQLRQLEAARPVRVAAKVRVADVLRIEQSGLSNEEFSYALRAHFDNVVYDTRLNPPEPLFAVEFDGTSHSSPDAQRRDALKDSICNRFSFPILRIDADFLHERKPRKSLLTWLSELWFEYEEFEDAQRRGDIPVDANFGYDYLYLVPPGGYRVIWDLFEQRLMGLEEDPDESYDDRDDDDDDEDSDIGFAFRPFALAGTERWSLGSAQNNGIIRQRGLLSVGTVNGRAAACLVLPVEGGYIVGKATCKRFEFPPIRDLDVVQELAMIDADVNLTRWLIMQDAPLSRADVDRIRGQMKPVVDKPSAPQPLYVKTAFGFTTMMKMFEVAKREITNALGDTADPAKIR